MRLTQTIERIGITRIAQLVAAGLWLAVGLAVSSDLVLANRLGPVQQQFVQAVKTQRAESCDNIGDLMATPHLVI